LSLSEDLDDSEHQDLNGDEYYNTSLDCGQNWSSNDSVSIRTNETRKCFLDMSWREVFAKSQATWPFLVVGAIVAIAILILSPTLVYQCVVISKFNLKLSDKDGFIFERNVRSGHLIAEGIKLRQEIRLLNASVTRMQAEIVGHECTSGLVLSSAS
jgi:hypothetical protein